MEQDEITALETFLRQTKFSSGNDFKELLWQKLLRHINEPKIYGAQVIDLSDEDIAKVAGGTADNFCHDKQS